MANVLRMTIVAAIHSIRTAGLSCREIARRLGIDRETVSRDVLHGPDPISKPASEPIFPAGNPEAAAGFDAPTGPPRSPTSAASPRLAWLLEQRERGLTAKGIPPGSPRRISGRGRGQLRQRATATQEAWGHNTRAVLKEGESAGPRALVDFGTGAPVIGPDGRRRKTHALRDVLSHARRGYSEAMFTQSTDDFIRCLENAFEHLGGVPHTIVIDNLKNGVLKADWFDPELNPKLADLRRHYYVAVN